MQTSDEGCRLLHLPVEILQRITNVQEVIPALRQTCKTLENITFDRFTEESFECVKCCIFDDARWLSLRKLLDSPSRITDKILVVNLTSCFLEDTPATMTQLAPSQDEGSHPRAQWQACYAYIDSRAAAIQEPVNVALVSRVLHDIKHVFPHIRVSFHVSHSQGPRFEHLVGHRDIIQSMLFSAQHRITSLTLAQPSIWGLKDVFTHLRPQLLQVASELRHFCINTVDEGLRGTQFQVKQHDFSPEELEVVYSILRSAKTLRSVQLHLFEFASLQQTQSSDIAQASLEAVSSRNLRTLSFRYTHTQEKDLLKALSRWASSLEHLDLGNICMGSTCRGWSDVLRLLYTMPRLRNLQLWSLHEKTAGMPNMVSVDFGSLTIGEFNVLTKTMATDSRAGKHYRNREEVVSGLKELLAEPLKYRDPVDDRDA